MIRQFQLVISLTVLLVTLIILRSYADIGSLDDYFIYSPDKLHSVEKFVQKNPNNEKAKEYLGMIYNIRGEYNKSLQLVSEIQSAYANYVKGLNFIALRKFVDAEKHLFKAYEIEPFNIAPLHIALELQLLYDFPKALETSKIIDRVESANSKDYNSISSKKWSKSLLKFEKNMKTNPFKAYTNLLPDINEDLVKVQICDKALKYKNNNLDKEYLDLLKSKGFLCIKTNLQDDSIKTFRELYEVDNKNFESIVLLAERLAFNKKKTELEKIIKNSNFPKESFENRLLNVLLKESSGKNNNETIKDFEGLLRISKYDSLIAYHIITLLDGMGYSKKSALFKNDMDKLIENDSLGYMDVIANNTFDKNYW